ncbi:MAG: hypothetical protein ABI268_13455, partial [Rhodanobacter sp.]
VLAVIASVLAVATIASPTWIELLFGRSLDGGDGSAERAFALLAVIVAAVALVQFARQRQNWNRLAAVSRD